MSSRRLRYVYGPVPSRRLGRSLGVDLVRLKTCTYNCIYCQLGPTTNRTIERKAYVPVPDVLEEVRIALGANPPPQYLSLAGSGEPTLHSGIGDFIARVKSVTSIPIAVLTNGSLLWLPEVRRALMGADLVLPSLDTGNELLFQHINRPHPRISFERMVDGLVEFTKEFPGSVWLEVFLLGGMTDIEAEAKQIGSIVERIAPERVHLNSVSRPPAEQFSYPVELKRLADLARYFPGRVEIVTGASGIHADLPAGREDAAIEIEAMLRRRPCTAADVAQGLELCAAAALKHLEQLIAAGRIKRISMHGTTFYAGLESSPEA